MGSIVGTVERSVVSRRGYLHESSESADLLFPELMIHENAIVELCHPGPRSVEVAAGVATIRGTEEAPVVDGTIVQRIL